MSSTLKIAFLGTGLMGSHMARNILKAGFSLTAWNRTLAKAQALIADGADVPATAAEAVAEADIVITMLSDGPTVHNLLFEQELVAAMKAGTLLIDMSSIKPSEARTHAALMRERGLHHLDAPVSGGTKGAEAGSLALMAGGDEAVFAKLCLFSVPWGGLFGLALTGQANYLNWQTKLSWLSPLGSLLKQCCWLKKVVLTPLLYEMH